MSATTPNSHAPSRGLLVGAGLALGLVAGAGGAVLWGGGGKAAGPTANAQSKAVAKSELGGGFSNSAFTRKHQTILAGVKAAHAEEARKLSSQGRLQLLLDLFKEGRDKSSAWDPVGAIERQVRLNASVLAEDIPYYMKLLADPDSSLSKEDRGSLQNLVLRVAAQGNMRELLKQYEDSDPKFAKALQDAFRREAAARDPFEAIRHLKEPGKAEDGYRYFNSAPFYHAAQLDPERAMQEAQGIESFNNRQSALGSVLLTVGYTQGFEKAWAMSQRIKESGIRFNAQSNLISSLSQASPEMREKMLEFLSREENASLSGRALNNIVSNWGSQDPRAAVAWAQKYAQEQGGGDPHHEAQQMLTSALHYLARTYPEEALPIIAGMDENQRSGQIQTVFSSLADRDVEKALSLMDKMSGKDLSNARSAVVQNWAQQDPMAAANFVTRLGDFEGRENTYYNLISGWAQYDSMGASEWLADQPSDKARDRGIDSLISQIQSEDMEAAMAWSRLKSTPDSQFSSIRSNIYNWANRDAVAAANWVRNQTSTLEPKQVEELLKAIERQKESMQRRSSRSTFHYGFE